MKQEHIEEARKIVYDWVWRRLENEAETAIADAIAAAEERGRVEERERCAADAQDAADKVAGDWDGEAYIARLIIAAITKEPTP